MGAKSQSKFEFAYSMLERRITSGDWKIGERLPDEELLARELGCSRGTINKALSRLSHENLVERRPRYGTRVKSLTQRIQPSPFSLNAVAFICPSEEHESIWRIAQGFRSAAQGVDRRTLILSSKGDLKKEVEMIGRLGEMDVRGAAVYPVITKPEDLVLFTDMVLRCPFPVVLVCLNLPGIGRPLVTEDAFDTGFVLASHLISRGISKVGFVTNYSWTQAARDRHLGYRSAMRSAGLEIKDSWVCLEYSMRPDFTDPVADLTKLVKKYLSENPDLEGIVCGSDFLSHASLIAARELGLKVPDQLKIVGVDSSAAASSDEIRLTAYLIPYEEVGRAAFDILEKTLSGEDVSPIETQIKGKLVVGNSS